MPNWGKRKDGQAYQKNSSKKGIKSSSTNPVADVHLKEKKNTLFSEILKLPTRDYLLKQMQKGLKESKYNDNDAEKQSFEEGFDRGVAMAESVTSDLSKIKLGTKVEDLDFGDPYNLDFDTIETIDDLKEFYRQWAFSAEENDREYSPFEFQAKDLREREYNDDGEQISEAFDAFDEGIAIGIGSYLEELWKQNLGSKS